MKTKRNSFDLNSVEVDGVLNLGFVPEENVKPIETKEKDANIVVDDVPGENANNEIERQQWGHPIEFILSCVALSVGLGNIWRFPKTAFENGGGTFLIPYLIVLLFIGRPMYFMELAIGQFSSSGCVKIWKVCPALKGVGYGQVIATASVSTYYVGIMAVTLYYLVMSCQEVLPWSYCDPDWADMDTCVSASDNYTSSPNVSFVPSSEQYYQRYVMKQPENLDNGPGEPLWGLVICLFVAWVMLFGTLVKGVASSGKVAYFTALFPYVVLITLLIIGLNLDGAFDGIIYFFTFQPEKLLDPNVWYAAVTQSFFSLSVGFGSITMFSSYNGFTQNIYRDAIIISLADTCTSLLAGVTTFAILGNLQYETKTEDISTIVTGGSGLAFVTYPTVISKLNSVGTGVPQLLAVLFFLMLLTLGVGSAAALTGTVITIICDQFPSWPKAYVTFVICVIGFTLGLPFVTPAGFWLIDLVDFFGGNFIIFILVIIEVVGINWIYGISKFRQDIKFMLGTNLGIYWKFCWAFFIPVALTVILGYAIISEFKLPQYNGMNFPPLYYGIGWALAGFALATLPIGFIHALYIAEATTLKGKLIEVFQPKPNWGPKRQAHKIEWLKLKEV